MKIEKAIEILTICNRHGIAESGGAREEAIDLGIEALKREQMRRGAFDPLYPKLLPGETNNNERR